MPVYKLKEEMPYTELLQWLSYLKRRPVGWRDDQRTFLLLQALGYKGKPEDVFITLKLLKEGIPQETKALPKGKFLDMMLKAKEGDGSGWKPPWMTETAT